MMKWGLEKMSGQQGTDTAELQGADGALFVLLTLKKEVTID